MNRRLCFAALAMALAIALTVPALWACSCPGPPEPAAALQVSTAVFLGKVVAMDDAPGETWIVTLSVERWWKGGDAAQVKVRTIKSGATCGYGFQKDMRYLVYAGQGNSVSLCSRTRTAKQAEDAGDFKAIGEGTKPR